MRTLARRQSKTLVWTLLSAAALAVLLFGAPNLLDPFRLNLLGKYLCYAMVAVGLDLAWGYAGLLSLGQSVFFGLGAYAFGMYLKLESAHGKLPDFMSWSGLNGLPGYWRPFSNPLFALAMAIALPAAAGTLLAYLLSRSRIGGVYFAIISQALAFIASTLFVGQQPFTGGTNGLTDFRTILGQPLEDPAVHLALYRASVVALALCLGLGLWLARSRFGRLLIAMRDDEQRVRYSGFNPALLQAAVFGVAGGMAGLAGALYVPQVGIVNPDALGVLLGIQMVIWVAVGGRATLWGAVMGAIAVNAAQSAFSETFPDVWQYAIGLLFVGSVLLFPSGLAGMFHGLGQILRRGGLSPAVQPEAAPAEQVPELVRA